jgi:hypothetical protein
LVPEIEAKRDCQKLLLERGADPSWELDIKLSDELNVNDQLTIFGWYLEIAAAVSTFFSS